MDGPPAARFQGDAVASTRRPARGQAWNCAVRPDCSMHNSRVSLRSPRRPRDVSEPSLPFPGSRSRWGWLLEIATRGSLCIKQASRVSTEAIIRRLPGHLRSEKPVARHHHNLEPTSRAAPPPPRRPDNTTQPQTQEALLPHPPPRQAPAPSPRAQRGAAPWRRPAAA